MSGAVPVTALLPSSAARQLTVRRCWPRADGGLIIEGVDATGRVRAARMRAGSDALTVRKPATDARLPSLPRTAARGHLVVHRDGKRAVVAGDGQYFKVVAPQRRDELLARTQRAESLFARAGVRVPGTSAGEEGVLVSPALPGRALHEWAQHADSQTWREMWLLWQEQWAGLIEATTGAGELRPHTPQDEAAILQQWWEHVRTFGLWRSRGEAFARDFAVRVRQGQAALTSAAAGSGTHCMAHRDLHDKQIVVDDTARLTLGYIDCDTAAAAEPALDVANLLVHLGLRQDQGIWAPSAVETAAQAVFAVVARAGIPLARVEAYAAATRLRLACLYAFRPGDEALALQWATDIVDEKPLMNVSWPRHPQGAH